MVLSPGLHRPERELRQMSFVLESLSPATAATPHAEDRDVAMAADPASALPPPGRRAWATAVPSAGTTAVRPHGLSSAASSAGPSVDGPERAGREEPPQFAGGRGDRWGMGERVAEKAGQQ